MPDIDPGVVASGSTQIRELASLYLDHRFDILGSGWISVGYDTAVSGFEGVPPVPRRAGQAARGPRFLHAESRRIAALIRQPGYEPIDWHRDHKSGFRWPEGSHAWNIRDSYGTGVDIKVPWELARMHHLVVLAYAYGLAVRGQEGFQPPARYADEFRSQLLDFISTNPPRRGVNWACTMDVGIRVANWLIAYDLFRTFGCRFDPAFNGIFARAVYEHGAHCFAVLEDRPFKGNHYLADIGGLLYASAYLPRTSKTDRWLAFAVRELAAELMGQFHQDGSNFEGSTCYHALSVDIVVHCALLCLLLDEGKRHALDGHDLRECSRGAAIVDPSRADIFDTAFWDRLERAVEFLSIVRRPDGALPQIGDNDSGRFLKLWPKFEPLSPSTALSRYRQLSGLEAPRTQTYWDEVVLDYDATCVVGELILGRADRSHGSATPLRGLLNCIIQHRNPPGTGSKPPRCAQPLAKALDLDAEFETALSNIDPGRNAPLMTEFNAPSGGSLTCGLTVHSYPGIGIFIFRSLRLYLVVRCGEVGQLGNGGHAHNDQLAIELVIDGQDLVRDPGTYVYTASVERRNLFRSTASHFTPRIGTREQNTWRAGRAGLFSLVNASGGKCHHVSSRGFIGSHTCFGHPVTRVIELHPDRVTIHDFGAESAGAIPNILSNGYGRWLR